MLIGYGDFEVSWAIGGSHSGYAFTTPTDGSALTNGRTGQVQGMRWIDGTQNTSSYVELTGTITSPYDSSTPRVGVVGIANVSGLPVGTKVTSVTGSKTQNLVRGERRELSAWVIPLTNSSTVVIRIFNDVGGTSPIVAGAEFAIGEIFVGRVIQLPALAANSPTEDIQDPTAYDRSAGGQLYQTMRKEFRVVQRMLGPNNITDTLGGSLGTLTDGGNAAGTLDLRALRSLLVTSPLIAVCGAEAASLKASGNTTASGITFHQDFMQANWMCARLSQAGAIVDSSPPFWTWAPTFMEAT